MQSVQPESMAHTLRRSLAGFAYATLYLSGAVHLAYWLNRRRQVVVTYHNVLPDRMLDDSLHSREVHAESIFARQLAIIRRRFPVTIELGRPGTCLITLDDGYANNARIAGPLLAEAGAPAYFFVPLETAQHGSPNWVDKFRLWVGAVPPGTYRIAGVEIAISDIASRHRAGAALWRTVEEDYRARHAVLEGMHSAVSFDALPIDPALRALRYHAMTAAELARLAGAGHRIGCHSRAHDILTRLSADELEADFRACADHLGALYNTRVYAYPFGGTEHLDERVIAACRSAGFSAAFTYLPSLDGTAFAPGPFTMPRLTLPNTASRFAIEARLSGAEGFLRRLARFAKHELGPRVAGRGRTGARAQA
jgi:peptidoglycan/xylan/chitin deacetylase (PgdA/CDA1 family)